MLKQIGDILAIAIDNDSGEYCLLDTKKGQSFLYEDRQRHSWRVDLPPGSWELIGLSHLLTSEQKEMVCPGEDYQDNNTFEEKFGYRDYLTDYARIYYNNVDDSYKSWLEANGIKKNTVLLKLKK